MKTTRVQMELPERAYERMVELKATTEAASYAEVVKNALRVYEELVQRQAAGQQLYVRPRDGGTLTELKIL